MKFMMQTRTTKYFRAMLNEHIRKQRIAILKALNLSEKRVLKTQIKNHSMVAVSAGNDTVKVINAQDLL